MDLADKSCLGKRPIPLSTLRFCWRFSVSIDGLYPRDELALTLISYF